ncbi:MAG TPA: methylisocitrate lyase [Verrucomicrobiae bacterium]|nr:methylisocitrate lyase [Verrucomicrobiae bacterium]
MKSAARQRPSGKHATSAGARLRAALRAERPLQVAGVVHAYAAILAENAGFRALYLSGAGVANASYGVPDIGLTALDDVLIDVRRITSATKLPLLVDADTGWNNPARTVREMIREGAAGVHIEDQVEAKRCGHLGGKQLVEPAQMVARIKAAIAGRTDPEFVIMARTDAGSVEGLDAAVARAKLYRDAGADMIFAEALTTLDEYRKLTAAVKIPVLANITEFGKTPLFTTGQLNTAGVRLVLYPLSAFRAMNAAALKAYRVIRKEGTQRKLISQMQTRAELYELLGYDALRKGTGK